MVLRAGLSWQFDPPFRTRDQRLRELVAFPGAEPRKAAMLSVRDAPG